VQYRQALKLVMAHRKLKHVMARQRSLVTLTLTGPLRWQVMLFTWMEMRERMFAAAAAALHHLPSLILFPHDCPSICLYLRGAH